MRVSSSGLEPIIDLGAPAGAQSIYALDGSVDPNGDPEALALAGFLNSTYGTYYARGPQTAPALAASVSSPKISHKKLSAKFSFSSGAAASGGASLIGFQCALVRLSKHKHSPKPHFGSCKSPKTYKHLKHGKYKFFLRAVFTVGTGPTLTRKFKI